MIFDRLADAITSHAKLIIILWVIILVISAPLALKAGSVMSYDTSDMADPSSESIQGSAIIAEYFPKSDIDMTTVPIVILYYGDESGKDQGTVFIDELNEHIGDYESDEGLKLSLFISVAPMDKPDGTGIYMVAAMYDGEYTSAEISNDTPCLRDYIESVAAGYEGETGGKLLLEIYLTGNPAITFDMSDGAMKDLSRIDPFTVLLILLLVGLFFRSFVTSATPPITIGFAFVVVLAIIFGLGQILNIFFITEMMLLVSMMGAGCDYCIFIIARYREELRAGRSHEEALHDAVTWAGESIATSGASVIIGFGAMTICSFSLVSTMGLCLALGILVALMAALTLIPAILAVIGDKVFWPSTMESFKEGGKSLRGWYAACGRLGAKYFEKSSHFSLKHAKAIAIVTVLVSVPAAYLAMTNETSYDMITPMESGESGEGMAIISDYANAGLLMPDYAVIAYREPIATIEEMTSIHLEGITVDLPQAMGTLEWNDYWSKEARSSLLYMAASMKSEYGIASVDLPYQWDAEVSAAIESGAISLSDPEDAMAYLVQNAPSSAQLILSTMVDTAVPMIVDYMIEAYPTMTEEQAVYLVDYMLLTQGGKFIDYVVNVEGGYVSVGSDGNVDGVTLVIGSVTSQPFAEVSQTTTIQLDDITFTLPSPMSTLVWEEAWMTSMRPALVAMAESMESEYGLAEVAMPYQWDLAVLEAVASGAISLDSPVEAVTYLRSNAPSSVALYLDQGLGRLIPSLQVALKLQHPEMTTDEVRYTVNHGLLLNGGPIIDYIVDVMSGAVSSSDSGALMDTVSMTASMSYAQPVAATSTVTSMTIGDMDVDLPVPISGLVWSDKWPGIKQGLDDMIAGMEADDNVADVEGPYQWDAAVSAAIESGAISLDQPKEALDYLIANAPNVVGQYLKAITDSFIPMMLEYAKQMFPGIPDEMVEQVVYRMFLTSGGELIDYQINTRAGFVGGDYVDGGNSVSLVKLSVSTEEPAMSPRSMETIHLLDDSVDAYMASEPLAVQKWVTGSAVIMYEISEVISGEFTMIEILVVVLILILLFVVMRSYTIPFRSIVTILMSISWTLAMTHIVFVDILGGEVTWLIPLILLVICLGLGMDYDILLTTRIKENVKVRGMTNDEAIHHAVTHTGSVITVCGLIMGGAFGTLMLSSMVMMQQFGFALCFAILVDSLIVRTYIVPAIMHLLGDWNWKGPGSFRSKSKAE